MTHAIEDLAKESLKAPVQPCSEPQKNSQKPLFSADHSQFDRKAFCQNDKNSCVHVELANVCEQSRMRNRKESFERNRGNRKKRWQSSELRKETFSYALSSFAKMRDSLIFQERCCPKSILKTDDSQKKCISFFSSTQLFLLKGLSEEDLTADYQGFRDDPFIEISEARLLYCKNQECIDDVLLHEMGHACQHSRGNMLELFQCQVSKKVIKKDLTLFFGKTAAECVLDGLNTEFKYYSKSVKLQNVYRSKKYKLNPPCLNRWTQEAFADLIFIDQRKSPAAYERLCRFSENISENINDDLDETHGPSYVSECVLNQSPYREALCGAEPECDLSRIR